MTAPAATHRTPHLATFLLCLATALPSVAGAEASPCPERTTFFPGSAELVPASRGNRLKSVMPLCVDQAQVSAAEFDACVEAGACRAPGRDPIDPGAAVAPASIAHRKNRCSAAVAGAGERPVSCVDWVQADAYCRARQARLPTAEEWAAVVGGDPRGRGGSLKEWTATRVEGVGMAVRGGGVSDAFTAAHGAAQRPDLGFRCVASPGAPAAAGLAAPEARLAATPAASPALVPAPSRPAAETEAAREHRRASADRACRARSEVMVRRCMQMCVISHERSLGPKDECQVRCEQAPQVSVFQGQCLEQAGFPPAARG